jgi:DNA-binding winged helix-turn-helix (wHTH) protein/Tfp pilus assembly protein PilF
MDAADPDVFAFGAYRLDTGERRLLCGNEEIPLEPKVFDTLLVLVRHAGRLVSKDVLMSAVWPDTHVEEGNLTRNVSVLRRALGTDAEAHIETVPKYGYRFVGEVTRTAATVESAPCFPETVAPAGLPTLAALIQPSPATAHRQPWSAIALLLLVVGGSVVFVGLTRGMPGDAIAKFGRPDVSTSGTPSSTAEPVELYLKGRHYLNTLSDEGIARAASYFRRAIEVDPGYAPAHAGLAEYYATIAAVGTTARMSPAEAYPLAKASALKALSLDETVPGAHTVLALVAMDYEWDHDGADRAFRRAIALAPQHVNAHHWYSHFLVTQGRFEESLEESRRALALDPLDIPMNYHLGFHYYYARQYLDAERQLRATLMLDPSSGDANSLLGISLAQQGRHQEGIAAMQRGMALGGLDVRGAIVAALARAGRRAESDALLAELLEEEKHRYVSPYELARAHAGRGEIDKAFGRLEQACDGHAADVRHLGVDPSFDGLRTDPRLVRILERVGLAGVPGAVARR